MGYLYDESVEGRGAIFDYTHCRPLSPQQDPPSQPNGRVCPIEGVRDYRHNQPSSLPPSGAGPSDVDPLVVFVVRDVGIVGILGIGHEL